MDFCERLKQVRKLLNMSQSDLAKELGVAFTTINRWENGHFKPNYDAIKNFEKYCESKNIDLK